MRVALVAVAGVFVVFAMDAMCVAYSAIECKSVHVAASVAVALRQWLVDKLAV